MPVKLVEAAPQGRGAAYETFMENLRSVLPEVHTGRLARLSVTIDSSAGGTLAGVPRNPMFLYEVIKRMRSGLRISQPSYRDFLRAFPELSRRIASGACPDYPFARKKTSPPRPRPTPEPQNLTEDEHIEELKLMIRGINRRLDRIESAWSELQARVELVLEELATRRPNGASG